jgi:uncharacterized protein
MTGDWVWFDLMSKDVEASKRFYTTVLGWGVEAWPMGDQTYTMFKGDDNKTLGGVMPLTGDMAHAPPMWVGYVSVADCDASAAKATQLGAKVLFPPTDIPSVGRFATVQDPQGAVFNLFQGKDPTTTPRDLRTLRNMGWHELATQDAAGSWRFYSELLGWNKGEGMEMGPGMVYQMYQANGRDLGGMSPTMNPQQPTAWMFYVNVPNCAETLALAQANGATPMYGPMDVPGGRKAAAFMDPQGAAIGILGD